MTKDRPREVEVRPFPSNRRLVAAAMRAGRRATPMHGLVEVDVTEAKRLLAEHEPVLSFTAFIVASVARIAAAHPEVHAYRNWRGQLVLHRHVDVTTIVEIATRQGPFPLTHVIRDADIRDVVDLTSELRGVKTDPSASGSGRLLLRGGHIGARVPGLIPAMYALMARSPRLRQVTGTVAVTAVGMFGRGGGFAIAPLTLMPLQIVVGGMSARPRVIQGQIEVRDVLDLTVTIDHNIVDGAPAARFGAELRELIESATVLRGLRH
ncbi:MAG TPA: 2-oxo acid dehydrogenase subunit E2 [Mycobacterium sp.]|nr:2-oxo acid dehydrogenase subunit E2 [Mycobacterium sp.]